MSQQWRLIGRAHTELETQNVGIWGADLELCFCGIFRMVGNYAVCLYRIVVTLPCLCRLWGLVHWLQCSECHQPFQCSHLHSCHYHPLPATTRSRLSRGPPVHGCCGSMQGGLSPFPLTQVSCSHLLRCHVDQSV